MDYFLLRPPQSGYKIKIIFQDKDILICKEKKTGERPDFLDSPCLMISTRVKELLERFLFRMTFQPCVIEGEYEAAFWTFKPYELPKEAASYQLSGLVKTIRPFDILPFVKVPNYKKDSYLVNLMFAECLLRRQYIRLELEQVEIRKGEELECTFSGTDS